MTDERVMSVWEAVSTKRMVREFADRPLDPDHIVRILNAGRRAGSSKNLQRWQFIVFRDRDHLRELAAVGPWADHLAGAAVAIALSTPVSMHASNLPPVSIYRTHVTATITPPARSPAVRFTPASDPT